MGIEDLIKISNDLHEKIKFLDINQILEDNI